MRVFLLFAVLQLGSLAAMPWLARAVADRDRGYGLARLVGWLALGLVSAALAFTPVPATGWIGWGLLALALAPLAHPRVRRELAAVPRREIVLVEALFYATVLLFLFLRSCQPEIFWGEKPMDFTFLNFFVRLEHLPPEDPWAAGSPMRYYYLGTYLVALLHKMTGLDTAVGYNVALAVLAGLFVTAGYSALRPLLRRRHAALAALGLLLLADFESFRLAVFQTSSRGFDLFWASSRITPAAIANEYPQWSFLFADLHAHLIALPFSLSALAIAISLLTPARCPGRIAPALYGALWGSLLAINTWDFLSLGVVTAALLPFLRHRRQRLAMMAVAGTLVSLPFLSTIANGGHGGIRLERVNFFTGRELLRYLGQFLVPALAIAVWRWRRTRARPWELALAPLLFLPLWEVRNYPWEALSLATATAAVGIAVGRGPRRWRVAGFLLLVAGLLIGLGESFFVRDRMNSVFKLCLPLWLLCGLALAALLPYLRLRLARWIIVPALAAATLGALVNVAIQTEFRRVKGPRGTLDGLAYLRATDPEERALAAYLQREIPGTPRIAEAYGKPYGPYARVAMRTGLPSWIGWEHHAKQRGLSEEEAHGRERQVEMLYRGTDADAAYAFLRAAGIELVIVGSLERATYGAAGLAKFRDPKRYRELARFGDEAVYRVLGDHSLATSFNPSMPN